MQRQDTNLPGPKTGLYFPLFTKGVFGTLARPSVLFVFFVPHMHTRSERKRHLVRIVPCPVKTRPTPAPLANGQLPNSNLYTMEVGA